MMDEASKASIVSLDNLELAPEVLLHVLSWIELPNASLSQSTSDARRAFYHWPCQNDEVIATLLIIPGLGEHGGRYAESAGFFNAQGLNVCSIDVQGHGHSPGKRACIESYESLQDDVEAAKREVDRLYPGLPCVIWGHSMGGNLVINYLLRRQNLPHCAIASAPMLRAVKLPSHAFIWIARQLARFLPNMQLSSSVDSSDCTRDERFQKMMRADKLYFRTVSLRLGAALIDSGEWALQNASQLKIPLLLAHGLSDVVTSADASREFAKRSGRHCELKLIEDSLHDIHRDLNRNDFYQMLLSWIRGQLS